MTDYRVGLVFVAGDAAHVHSPIGGQGMNTGIQDGANLAWKLDAALDGASADVLDTYQAERRPIGNRVLFQCDLMTRAVTLHPRLARGVRDLVAPRLLSLSKVRDLVAGSFADTELRYDHGKAENDLVGTRATEVPLAEGPLTALQRKPGFALVRERGNQDEVALGPGLRQAHRADDGPAFSSVPTDT